MEKITIYTKPGCPFCMMAKRLLKKRNLDYHEYSLSTKEQREQQKEKTGQNTFPQIFFDKKLIGGYQELKNLDENNKLT